MQIEQVSISTIRPYESNPRINDQAVEAVARSIQEFGFKVPIVVDAQGVIITGHTRYKAAKLLGLNKVPVIKATDLSDTKVKAFRLADNKVGEIAKWDNTLLAQELKLLADEFTGFSEIEISELLEDLSKIVEDEQELELPAEPSAKLGEVYQLGSHRLMCGDSTKLEDVKKLTGGCRQTCFCPTRRTTSITLAELMIS